MLHIAQVLAAAMLAFASHADAPTSATVAFAIEIGITPESLVVAGFSANDAQSLVDNMGTASESQAALASAHSLVSTKTEALATAETALAESPSNANLIAARNTARTELAAAEAALRATRTTVRAAILASQNQERKDGIAAYLSGAGRMTPPEFKAISRTAAEWTALEAALRAEARAARLEESLGEAPTSLLSTARGNASVTAAKTRLDNTLTTVKAMFVPAS